MRIILTSFWKGYERGTVFKVKSVDERARRYHCWSQYGRDISVPFKSGEEYTPLTSDNR